MWLPDVMTSTPAPSSALAVDAVRPIPPATFSPLAVTKSIPRSSRRPGRTCSTATRPGLPIMSPIIRTRTAPGGRGALPFGGLPGRVRPIGPGDVSPVASVTRGRYRTTAVVVLRRGSEAGDRAPAAGPRLGVLHGARLADDRHLDLTRVGQLFLDLADDVAGQSRRRQVVDLFQSDEDPDLLTGMHRERPLDALEAVGDRLEILEPLHVGVHRLAVGARPGRA